MDMDSCSFLTTELNQNAIEVRVVGLLNVNSTDRWESTQVRCYYDTLWSNTKTTRYSLKQRILQFSLETRKIIWRWWTTQKLSSETVTTAVDVIIVLNVKKMQQQHLHICSSTTHFPHPIRRYEHWVTWFDEVGHGLYYTIYFYPPLITIFKCVL